jgi:protein-tyrosine phosphatase
MIDLHTHILSELDDGPKDLDESLKMCQLSYGDGIETVVATPHTLNGIYQNDRATILKTVQELNEAMNSALATRHPALSLSVLPGADVHFCPDLVRRFEQGEVETVNDTGRYMMIEFPPQGVPSRAEEVLFQLLAKGIIPIITHPERNGEFLQRPQRYYGMIRMGCLGQVTAMSLTGEFGSLVKRVAERLLKNRLIHIIATDAHSSNGRPPILSRGLNVAATIVGKEEARRMVTEYPQAILEGRRPNIPEPIPL